MPDTGTPPEIPAALQQYNSFAVDPHWQRIFTVIWVSVLAGSVSIAFPRLLSAIKQRRAFQGVFGVRKAGSLDDTSYSVVSDVEIVQRKRSSGIKKVGNALGAIGAIWFWSPPYLGLNLGQATLVLAYFITVIICTVRGVELVKNPNRAGFLALAQLPVVFLFATKNSLVSLLLGPGNGYERLNFIHRWASRCMFLGACVHGFLWIRNRFVWNLPILGMQKEMSGIACISLLCMIFLSSLRPVRRAAHQLFFVMHVICFVAFFPAICYHTIYASPWIFPPLVLYGLDHLIRVFKYRIKDATLEALDDQMTLIRIPSCDSGWIAGQHINLRIFFSTSRLFESHSFTILNATPNISCRLFTSDFPEATDAGGGAGELIFGARVSGDWTRALNTYTHSHSQSLDPNSSSLAQVPIKVMLGGPYGGCSVDLGKYENILLIAGGSGATFTIGILDDIVGRCVRKRRRFGEVTKKIEFVWFVRNYDSIGWFASFLADIAQVASEPQSRLDLHFTIFITRYSEQETPSTPPIPNLDIIIQKPSASDLLKRFVMPEFGPPADEEAFSLSADKEYPLDNEQAAMLNDDTVSVTPLLEKQKPRDVGIGGGVCVCAAGPSSLTREVSNAVAMLSIRRGIQLGGIALHTEAYSC